MAASVLQSNQGTGNSTSPSVSITVPSGSDMIVLVALWVTGDQAPTAAGTIGGQPQTPIYSSGSMRVYRAVAPAAGATSASFTLATAADWSMHVAVLGGVDQSLLTGTPVAGTNDGETTVGASVTLTAEDLAFGFGFMPTQTLSLSAGTIIGSANLGIQGGWRSSAIGSNAGTGSVPVTFATGESLGDNYAVVVPVFGATGGSPATKLAWTAQPGNTVVGQPIAAVQVSAQDAGDANDESFTGNITIALQTGSGTLSGTLTRAAVAGVATFSGLSINTLNTGAVLRATASGLTQADSSSFNITAGGGGAGGGSLVGCFLVSS